MSAVIDGLAEVQRTGHIVVRTRGLDLRVNARVLALCGIGLGIGLALAAWSMTMGSFPMTVADVVVATLDRGTPQQEFVVWELRIDRKSVV